MKRRAYTLIEMMICIAILAILMAIPINAYDSLGNVVRERDYRLALRCAQLQVEQLRTRPLDALPPRVLRAGASGWLELGQTDLVEGSVSVRTPEGVPLGPPAEVDLQRGRIRLAQTSRQVLVDYRFAGSTAAGEGEAYSVQGRLVHLVNGPVIRVSRVVLAQGDGQDTLTGWRLTPAGLELPARAQGHVVLVDYSGQRLRCEVRGEFRSELLERQVVPGPFKLVTVDVVYGGDHKLSLALLRVPR